MYIDKVKIKNFKIIEDREFKFNKINLFEGSNGFGKSSVFDAIIYLFTNHVDAKIEDYINWDADRFNIEADLLDYNNKKINYSIQLSKTMKRLLKTEDDEYKQSAATQYLSDIINPNIALYSNISVQGKSTQLLFEKPTPRLEKFKLLFGINEVDIAVDKIKDKISELKVKVDKVQSEIKILKEKKFEYLDEEELEDFSSLESEVELLKVKKEKYDLELKTYYNYRDVLLNYETKIEAKEILEIELNQYSEKLSKLKDDLTIDSSILDDLKNEELKINSKLKKLDSDKILSVELNFKINNLIKKISDLDESMIDHVIQRIKPFDYTDEYRKELELREKAFLSDCIEAKFIYDAIKEGKCPKCKTKYTSDNIKEALKLYTELDKEHEEIFNLVKNINEEEKVYNEKVNQNEIAKTKLESINSQIKSCQSEIQSYKDQIDKLDLTENKDELLKRGAYVEKEISIIKVYNIEYEQLEKDIIIIETKLENYLNLIEPKVIIEPEAFNSVYFEDKKKELYVFQEKEENLKKIQELNEKIELEEKNNIKLISEKEESIDTDRKELRLIETAKKILSKDFISYLVDWGTEYTKTKMNEIFQKSYGRYNVTLNRDPNGKGVDFYYFSPKNKKVTNVNLASGYEKQLLSLSFRMAIASLHKLGIFIFDEIDSDSDEANSLKLYKVILSQTFKQIFVVTHKEPTKDYLRGLPDCSTFNFSDNIILPSEKELLRRYQ